MAYVYNQQNQDEQQQSGSNVFAPPGQDGQAGQQPVEKTGASGTLTAGMGMPLGGSYRGRQTTGPQVTEQARGQRQARLPLQQIYARNVGESVSLPDFSKTMQQIKGAQEGAKQAAEQYAASERAKVQTLGEEDVSGIAGGQEPATQKAQKILTPQQAALSEQFAISSKVPAGLAERFGTSAGLIGEYRKERQEPSLSRGAAALDVSLLQKQPEFQRARQAVLRSGQEVEKEQTELLKSVPEQTKKAVQDAIDASRVAAKSRLEGEAAKYETTAADAQKAYDKARGDIQAAINTGELTPAMASQLSNWFEGQFGKGITDQETKDYLRGFLTAPNQEAQLRQNLAEIQSVGGTIPQYFPGLTYNPTQAFRATATPQELTAFMAPEQFTPYSRIKGVLGEVPVAAAAAPTSPLEFTAPGQTQLADYLAQAGALQSGALSAGKEYDNRKNIVQSKINELNALRKEIESRETVPGQLMLPTDVNPEYLAKKAELEQTFRDQTAKFSEAKRDKLAKELGLSQYAATPTVQAPQNWDQIIAAMNQQRQQIESGEVAPGGLYIPGISGPI